MCVRACVRVCMCMHARVCICIYLQACGLGVDVSGKCVYVIIMCGCSCHLLLSVNKVCGVSWVQYAGNSHSSTDSQIPQCSLPTFASFF